MEALLTRQSDALTSPSEWLVFFFPPLAVFCSFRVPDASVCGVRRGCDCLEMKS